MNTREFAINLSGAHINNNPANAIPTKFNTQHITKYLQRDFAQDRALYKRVNDLV